jgi:hypothetical protein
MLGKTSAVSLMKKACAGSPLILPSSVRPVSFMCKMFASSLFLAPRKAASLAEASASPCPPEVSKGNKGEADEECLQIGHGLAPIGANS